MSKPRKITVATAATLMGKCPLFVREAMRRELLNIGTAMQMPGSIKWTFYISPALLAEQVGVTVERLWEMVAELEASA